VNPLLNFLAGILGNLVADELAAWLPRVTLRLVAFHAKRLPPSIGPRMAEEWTEAVSSIPGPVSKLLFALDLIRAVPALRREFSESRRGAVGLMLRDAIKRGLDIVGSLGLLVVLTPAFVAITVAVKLTSKGPVFIRQQRIGEGGQPFTMLRFRTMHVDADPATHQQHVATFVKNGVEALCDDPRVTSIGHFLRRSSLDELPQFWNVLKGEMSLVGPRPPLPFEVATYKRLHRRRLHEARPGVTGLWQVMGLGRTTFDEMVRLDVEYARTRTVWLDIKILLATPAAAVRGGPAMARTPPDAAELQPVGDEDGATLTAHGTAPAKDTSADPAGDVSKHA
jgi:lipopolysaccharide/colanic/teichoic acid biosynthesis glycosyltransferase